MSAQIFYFKECVGMSKVRKLLAWFSLVFMMFGIFIMLGSENSDHWMRLLLVGFLVMIAGWNITMVVLDTTRFLRHLFAHYVVFFSMMWKLGMRNENAELANETYKEFNSYRDMYRYLAERYYMEKGDYES